MRGEWLQHSGVHLLPHALPYLQPPHLCNSRCRGSAAERGGICLAAGLGVSLEQLALCRVGEEGMLCEEGGGRVACERRRPAGGGAGCTGACPMQPSVGSRHAMAGRAVNRLHSSSGGWGGRAAARAAREGCGAPSKAARGVISLDHGWGGASGQPHQHWRLWRAAGAGRAARGASWF